MEEFANYPGTACLLPYISKEVKSASIRAEPVSCCSGSSLDSEFTQIWVQKFRVDLKIKKPCRAVKPPVGLKESIFEFSDESRARLMAVCRNEGYRVASQFCLTYHDSFPQDGRCVKFHLNHFTTLLKQRLSLLTSSFYFLWCLEFQERGAPHIHFYSSLPCAEKNRCFWRGIGPAPLDETLQPLIANTWLQVSGLFWDLEAHRFHKHLKNFFAWNMTSGSYLAKQYIAKSVQKYVPKAFKNVGRFWGNSRNMKPEFVTIELEKLSPSASAGVVSAVRTLTKRYCKRTLEIGRLLQENRREKNQETGKPRHFPKPNPRKKVRSYSLPAMAALFVTLVSAHMGFINPLLS